MTCKAFLLSVALLALPFAANAGQMPLNAFASADPPGDWAGFYAGVNGGYGWGYSHQQDMPLLPPPPVIIPEDGYYKVNGGVIGGTLGYDRRFSNWLFGLEGDYAWSDINGSSSTCGGSNTCGTKLRSFGTARVRLGPVFGNTLIYATGGATFGDVHAYDTSAAGASGTEWRVGWTMGGGIEQKFTTRWSAKLEYLYMDFGNTDYFTIPNHTPEQIDLKVNVIRAGINYRF